MSSDSSSSPAEKKHRPILEYGPLVLFFITNYFAGIMWGTGVLVIATVIALTLSWIWDRRIPMMALFGGVAVALGSGGVAPTLIGSIFFENALPAPLSIRADSIDIYRTKLISR